MKATILVKPYWVRIILCLVFACIQSTWAQSLNPLYVSLSDAMGEVRQQQPDAARQHLKDLQQALLAIDRRSSATGQLVQQRLEDALRQPDENSLGELSKALYAWEREIHPVDYEAKRKQFARRVMPVYQQLAQAVQAQDIPKVQEIYTRFNRTWTVNEKAVRDTSIGHYGRIETAMNFLRIAISSEPPQLEEMHRHSDLLGKALEDFRNGGVLEVQKTDITTLPQGVQLLEKALHALQNQQTTQATEHLSQFLTSWPVFEGDVRTRNAALYARVESEIPLLIARPSQADTPSKLQTLVQDLRAIDPSARYGAVDAMLILLREGVEALVIIMALLTALRAAGQPQAARWIHAGAGLGILASVLGALALHQLLPTAQAGTNREILEGLIGIAAVLMMLLIGAWLHSKSSIQGWTRFIQRHIKKALATGSLLSMGALAFLSVFREGAETLLFYAGILPLISREDFLLGIMLACVILACIAFAMQKASHRLPLHRIFAVMTVLIYALGFKILGVSIHALQLTGWMPRHTLDFLPNIPAIGFYANWECLLAQLAFIAAIPMLSRIFR